MLGAGVVIVAEPSASSPQSADRRIARARAEPRGLWVPRTSLKTPEGIDTLVRRAADAGINTLFVQMRGRGDALFDGSPEPVAAGVAAGFDPLAHTLASAHAAGLEVHAWINVTLVASATYIPDDPRHIVRQRPEWLMLPRALAASLGRVAPRDPRYVSRLATWTRAQRHVEGLYASPVPADSARYLEAIVAGLASRYEIDGLHLDYIRFPSAEFDYSAGALAAFRDATASELTAEERTRLDGLRTRDALVYPRTFPARWTQFRQARVSDLVARLRTALKTARPEAALSAAVIADPDAAARDRLQDWSAWGQRGLIDVICPMAYTASPERFRRHVIDATRAAAPSAVWAGIGAYLLHPPEIARQVEVARTAGAGGIVLFSYDSFGGRPDPLAAVGRLAFAGPMPRRASTR
jgi:uncharacterized lipoprotein YddW (UPF0748 family)